MRPLAERTACGAARPPCGAPAQCKRLRMRFDVVSSHSSAVPQARATAYDKQPDWVYLLCSYANARKHWLALGQKARRASALTQTMDPQRKGHQGTPVPELGPGWLQVRKRSQEAGHPQHSYKVRALKPVACGAHSSRAAAG